MKVPLLKARESIINRFKEETGGEKLVEGRGASVSRTHTTTNRNGRKKKTTKRPVKYKRIMMTSLDRFFSVELIGRGKYVNEIRFTVYDDPKVIGYFLTVMVNVIGDLVEGWDDIERFLDTAITMPVDEGDHVNEPVKIGPIKISKARLSAVKILFVEVS